MWYSFCNSDINSLQIKKNVLSLIQLQEYSVVKCFLNPTNRGNDISNYQNVLYMPLLYVKMDTGIASHSARYSPFGITVDFRTVYHSINVVQFLMNGLHVSELTK